jgi:hypothetical protein
MGITWNWRGREKEELSNGHRVPALQDKNVQESCTAMCVLVTLWYCTCKKG